MQEKLEKNQVHQTRYFKLENVKNQVQIDMGSGSQMGGIVLLIVINETKSVKIFHCVAHCQQHRATSEEGILLLARCKRENPIGQFSFLRLHFILVLPSR